MASRIISRSALTNLRRDLGRAGRRQLYARAARLRQPDCDDLLRGSRAVLSGADAVELLANKLTRLRAR